MQKVILTRLESSDEGTFGEITTKTLALFTGELPWRENKPSISCIPEGEYKGVWEYSPRFKRLMYLIYPVEARTGIRIHSANFMGDMTLGLKAQLNGCIALGERLGWIDGQKVVLLSKPAVRRFEDSLGGRPFEMEIRNG